MTNGEIGAGLIGVISVLLVLTYLNTFAFAERNTPPRQVDRYLEMRYSLGFKGFALGLLVLLGICLVALTTRTYVEIVEVVVFSGFLLGLALMAYLVVREAFEVRVQFDAKGVKKLRPWGSQDLRWVDVEEVTYSGSYHAFELVTLRGRVRVSRYMCGLTSFLRHMNEHVRESALVHVRDDLYKLLRED